MPDQPANPPVMEAVPLTTVLPNQLLRVIAVEGTTNLKADQPSLTIDIPVSGVEPLLLALRQNVFTIPGRSGYYRLNQATRQDWQQTGLLENDPNFLMSRIKIVFDSNNSVTPGVVLVRSSRAGVQSFSFGKSLFFSTGNSAIPGGTVALTLPIEELLWKFNGLHYLKKTDYQPYIGSTNNAPWFGLAQDCVRFDAADDEDSQDQYGNHTYQLMLKFSWRSIPWYKFFNPMLAVGKTNMADMFDTITDGAGVYTPYPGADLTALINIFAGGNNQYIRGYDVGGGGFQLQGGLF